jgi:hypothetical protein
MANIVVTEVGDILSIEYNDQSRRFSRYARNMVTGSRLAELANDKGIETDILCLMDIQYQWTMFDTIGGVAITSNSVLFDELKKML